jgi:hypothetical protein
VSTVHRHRRSSPSQPDVVGCGWEVAERVKKTTSIPERKKKEELPMKFLDDPKIPIARRYPQRPHHSHKPLDVAAETGLKPGRAHCTRRRHHHLNAAPTNLDPKNGERSPQNRGRSPPTNEGRYPPRLIETERFAAAPTGGKMRSNSPGTLGLLGRNVSVYYMKSYFYRRMIFFVMSNYQ